MRVLIAEDDLTSQLMLRAFLRKCGYEVDAVSDGEEAWNRFQEPDAPQLAVIDWMMPKMNGPDLCRKLRAQERPDPLYLIILTSKGDRRDIIAGLEAGADDYIPKPYDNDELRVRLEVGARLLESEEKVRHYAEKMEKLAEERARQLVHAERLATLGALSAGIAHEINNPLSFIAGNLHTQTAMWKHIEPCLRSCLENGVGDAGKLAFILKEMPDIFDGMANGVNRVNVIVKGLKGYSRKEEEGFSACNVNKCVEEALLIMHNALKHRVSVIKSLSDSLPKVRARAQQLAQVLINLTSNASDALEKTDDAELRITTLTENGKVKVLVEDNGPGIPPEKLNNIFDAFFTTKPRDKGTGLGLSISKGIMDEHGGELIAENRPEGGARFIMILPVPDDRHG